MHPLAQPQAKEVLQFGHPALRAVCEPIQDPSSEETHQIAEELMLAREKIGGGAALAAPQIGILKRMFIFCVPEGRNKDCNVMPLTAAINPTVEPIGSETQLGWEACWSLKGILAEVPRYKSVKYAYHTLKGDFIEGKAHGFFSKVLQHEFDHLNGVLHLDRVIDNTRIGNKEMMIQHVVQPEDCV